MPGNDLVVGLRLTADGKGFVGEVRVAETEGEVLNRQSRQQFGQDGR